MAQQEPFRLELVAPDSVAAGEPVPLVIRLTNTSKQPLDVYFTGREIAFDLIVRSPDGTVVWHRLAGRTVQSILQVRTFAPGERVELRDTWRPASPGSYTVEGVVPGQDKEPRRTGLRTVNVVFGP